MEERPGCAVSRFAVRGPHSVVSREIGFLVCNVQGNLPHMHQTTILRRLGHRVRAGGRQIATGIHLEPSVRAAISDERQEAVRAHTSPST